MRQPPLRREAVSHHLVAGVAFVSRLVLGHVHALEGAREGPEGHVVAREEAPEAAVGPKRGAVRLHLRSGGESTSESGSRALKNQSRYVGRRRRAEAAPGD